MSSRSSHAVAIASCSPSPPRSSARWSGGRWSNERRRDRGGRDPLELRDRRCRRRVRAGRELPDHDPGGDGRPVEFFAAEPELEALGVGLFGPVEVRRGSPRRGTILTTPKPGREDTDVAGGLADALKVPIALDLPVSSQLSTHTVDNCERARGLASRGRGGR